MAYRIIIREKLQQLATSLELDPDKLNSLYVNLESHYLESHRYYHNFRHIATMLRFIDNYAHWMQDWQTITLATLYHDIIYYPTQSDNERTSALFMEREWLPLVNDPQVVIKASEYIKATEQHQWDGQDYDLALFLDADLAILAAPFNEYQQYCRAIREEYSFVPSYRYRKARLDVLRKLFARRPMYYCPEVNDALMYRAWENIGWEIRQLTDWSLIRAGI